MAVTPPTLDSLAPAAPTLDSLEPATPPTPPTLDSLAAPAESIPPILNLTDSTKSLASSGPKLTDIPSLNLMDEVKNFQPTAAMKDFASTVAEGGSYIEYGMRPLGWPQRAATGAIAKSLALMGIPGGRELNERINPDGKILPDAYFSDISDFALDKAALLAGEPEMGKAARLAYASTKFGIGMAANILFDPIQILGIGGMTREAEELYKVGKVVEGSANELYQPAKMTYSGVNDRYIVSARVPLTDYEKGIKLSHVAPVIDAASKIPGVKDVANWVMKFSPDTGFADVDLAQSTHAAMGRGEAQTVINEFIGPNAQRGFDEAEKAAMVKAVESSPNLQPQIDKAIIRSARPGLMAPEADVRNVLRQSLLKQGISADRVDTLVEGAMDVKKMGARYVENVEKAGFLDTQNVNQKLRDNHFPRVMDPNYRGFTDPKKLALMKAKEAAEGDRLIKGSYLSTTDPIRYRKMRQPFHEANDAMKEATGLQDFFITDPHKAAAIRLLESQKLVRDKKLIEVISKYGKRLATDAELRGVQDKFGHSGNRVSYSDARAQGMEPIHHKEFTGKTIIVQDEHGAVKKINIKDMVFPKEIASKVSYYINPPAVTFIKAQLNHLNRIFRSTSFMSPGFWARNVADNTVKNVAQGVTTKTHLDTLALFTGKLSGIQAEANAYFPHGRTYSAQQVNEMLTKFGITGASSFKDGVQDFLEAGKKVTLSQAASNPVKLGLKFSAQTAEGMLHGISQFGERGENFTRAALFIQRLKEGYTPEMASHEVTKYLFDYTRNSPATDALRFFSPFIQHPLKTAYIAPELIGQGLRTYDTIQNTFPHVLAATFHDPMTQDQLNKLLPDNLRARDVIAGPLIPGNTLIGDLFKNPQTKGNLGSVIYFDTAVGMRILNHFNYFSKEANTMNYGLSPIFGALLRGFTGTDNFGHAIDLPGDSNIRRFTNRVNYIFDHGVLDTVSLHNTARIVDQAFGLGDPKYFEPNSVLLLKGAMGQFGGITNLDRDFFFKSIALKHERDELKKMLVLQLGREVRNNSGLTAIAQYVKKQYGQIQEEPTFHIYKNFMEKSAEMEGHNLASKAFEGTLSADKYAARIKNLDQTLHQINKAYQLSIGRYLEMARGAKSPQEARQKSGVGN